MGKLDQCRLIQDQLERLAGLHIDSAEFSCLKSLALFSPGEEIIHGPSSFLDDIFTIIMVKLPG